MGALSGLSGLHGSLGVFGEFLPMDLASLTLWLRADAGTFKDAAMTTTAALDGDVVGGWVDQSGSGNHATQSTAAKKPLLKLNIVNRLPTIRLDGTDDWLRTAATVSVTTFTFFMVFKKLGGVASPTFVAGTLAADAWSLQDTVNNQISAWGAGAGTYKKSGGVSTSYHLSTTLFTGSALQLWQNDVEQLGALALQAGGGTGAFSIGARNGTDRHSNIDIAEIVLYDATLSAANRQAVWDYLNARYILW